MSLSKEKPIEAKRDSFGLRVGDDLSEEILQYLSLEDKLRFEGVSKQFQRTVFERLYELDIRVKSDWNLKNLDLFLKKRSKLESINKIKVNSGQTYGNRDDKSVYNRLIELIVNNCHNLSQIKFFWASISKENRQKFVQNFSSKIVCLSICDHFKTDITSLLNMMGLSANPSNIKDVHYFFDDKYKNLKKFAIDLGDMNAITKLAQFVDNHKTTLKHLSVTASEDGKQIILSQISKLDQLIELKINFPKYLDEIRFVDAFNQLAVNCGKLKSISTNLFIKSKQTSDLSQFLSPLRRFKHLRRLELTFESDGSLTQTFMETIFKHFKGFEDLEYLRIISVLMNFSGEKPISLMNIDINLPNLRYLEIREARLRGDGSTPELLSRLTKLESIKIEVTKQGIADQIRTKLIENCRKIRTIDISIKQMSQNMFDFFDSCRYVNK